MSKGVVEFVKLGEEAMAEEEYNSSVDYFRQGLAIAPKDFTALFGMAEVLRFKEEYDKAAAYYREAQCIDPEQFYGHWEMAFSYDMAGKVAEARVGYEDCLRRDPDHGVARHLLAALIGETSPAAPKDYVEELFDDYAETFDQCLLNDLDYTVPDLIRRKLDTLNAGIAYDTVLDLGCGTGLVGAAIRDLCNEIHGVDLSAKMIEQANVKNIFSHTAVGDIVEFLQSGDLGAAHYDLIVAGDVFVYFGDLDPIFQAVRKRLGINRRFVFTVEKLTEDKEEDGYSIQRSGRYAHSRNYLVSCSERWNMTFESIEDIIPRKEGELLISGFLCCLKLEE